MQQLLFEDKKIICKKEYIFNAKIKIATLFSGIGAAEQALRKMNIENEIIFASDNDKFVKQSWQSNYSTNNWYNDVQQIDGTKYKNQIDILVGGSPCQSFSALGKQLGFKDTRGTLFYEYARVIKESQPKVFVYENVRAIISHDNKRTFKIMCSVFNELGYTYFAQVLNAKDYGIPQSRNRIFVVGFRKDLKVKNFKFPKSIELTTTAFDYLESAVDASYVKSEKLTASILKKSKTHGLAKIDTSIIPCQLANQGNGHHGYFVTLEKQKLIEQKISEKYNTTKIDTEIIPCQTSYQYKQAVGFFGHEKTEHEKVNKNINEKYFIQPKVLESDYFNNFLRKKRATIDSDVLCCQTAWQFGSKAGNYFTENNRIRALTPRECLRLMGFSDSFKIVVSDAQMYKQCGNSIVSNVLEALFKQILPFLN